MHFFGLLVTFVCCVLCVAADPQQIYGENNGLLALGTPGNLLYIRGQNDGVYKVPGVGGQFQHASSPAESIYTDKHGNSYRNIKQAGGPRIHAVSGPAQAVEQPTSPTVRDFPYGTAAHHQFYVTQPGRTEDVGSRLGLVQRNTYNLEYHEERSGRPVGYGNGVQDVGAGRFSVQRSMRSPLFRKKRCARVQGQNFVTNCDQAGVWNNDTSVWKRTDGRTVSILKDGSVIVNGNGRTLRVPN
ncbi:immune-induced peptides [Drosophila santomea]|uniref:immune-induced peptides n=1 Tax=Drosophila santomea TaxID=129105 RepID=UPI001954C9DD|nr:immune-induced peptides [Drosophila santomea]